MIKNPEVSLERGYALFCHKREQSHYLRVTKKLV